VRRDGGSSAVPDRSRRGPFVRLRLVIGRAWYVDIGGVVLAFVDIGGVVLTFATSVAVEAGSSIPGSVSRSPERTSP